MTDERINRRSSFGMKCVQCGHRLIAPERSEYWSDKRACHIWYCRKCSCCFRVLFVFLPPRPGQSKYDDRGAIFPSLLVA